MGERGQYHDTFLAIKSRVLLAFDIDDNGDIWNKVLADVSSNNIARKYGLTCP